MADGSIVIDTRLNNKGAEADLAALRAKCKSTSQQIAALDKQISAGTQGNHKLADNLADAKKQAEATASALDKMNAKLDTARTKHMSNVRSEYPTMSAGVASDVVNSRMRGSNGADMQQSDTLTAKLEDQKAKIAALTDEYQKQQTALAGMTVQRQQLGQQLDSENAAAAKAVSSLNISEALGKATKAFSKFGSVINRVAGKGFAMLQTGLKSVVGWLGRATTHSSAFGSRLKSIVSGALIFNGISAGLRSMTSYLSDAVQQSGVLKSALANLKGAAATAAAPLVQLLAPALATLANAAAVLFSYLAKLFSLLTGKSISSMQATAKGMSGVGSAAGSTAKQVDKATKSLAGFDEIEKLSAPADNTDAGAGGGAGGEITPDFGFTGSSPFLDAVLESIKGGDWFQVGQLIGAELRDSLNAIPWPTITQKATEWGTNLATTLNGIVATPGLWQAIGNTLAGGITTALNFLDTFVQQFKWEDLGAGIGTGLNTMFAGMDWEEVGRFFTDGLKMAFETLHGFLQQFKWDDFREDITTAIAAAFENVDLVQAAIDISTLADEMLQTATAAVQEIDWDELEAALEAVDWQKLFDDLFVFIGSVITGIGQTELGQTVFPFLGAFAGAQVGAMFGPLGMLIGAGIGLLAGVIVSHWDDISGALQDGFDFMNKITGGEWEKLAKIWDENGRGINATWEVFKQAMLDIWDAIWSGIKGVINSIIGGINGMISAVVGGINAVIGAANSLHIDVPAWAQEKLGVSSIGFNIPTVTAPQIPLLAQGAVIPANHEFLAMLGDQKSGTNIEAPLDTIKQAVAEVLASTGGQGYEVLDARLQELISVVCGISVGDEVIASAATRYNTKLAMVRGGAV